MPDNLLGTLLQKATGISAAPPDRGWFSADTPHPNIDTGIDILKGVTGLGDQGPAGPTATNAGQVLGAVLPLGGALKKITSTEHPAVSELLWLLGNYGAKGPNKEEALASALATRTTPSMITPTKDPIRLPKGFELPGHIPYSNNGIGSSYWYAPGTKFPKPPILSMTSNPRIGTGASSPGAIRKLSNAGLTEDLVKKIRAVGDLESALKLFPEVKPGTIKGIIKDGTFGWVK